MENYIKIKTKLIKAYIEWYCPNFEFKVQDNS